MTLRAQDSTPRERVRWRVFRAVDCPTCGAAVGKTCTGSNYGSDRKRRAPHRSRTFRYERQKVSQ